VRAQPVVLDVTVKITDLDYKPLPKVAGRLVVASDPSWQAPEAGWRFATDADGVAQIEARAVLDRRWRKYPTNFIGSLLSTRQQTEHLTVGTQLEYMTFRWLYVLELYRFPNNDTLLDDFFVHTPDARGAFTQRAERIGSDWKMPELQGLLMTTPGYEAWQHALVPDGSDPTGRRWILQLGFKRYPPPIQR
jgi:hypothetical protein